MSQRRLLVGDSVMIHIDDPYRCKNNTRTGLGLIRFIGFIPSLGSGSFTHSIGVELIQPIHDGHDGSINNTHYFNVENGYGIIVPITNIISVLSTNDIMLELKKTIHLLQRKNAYIEQLEAIISSKTDYLPPIPSKPKLTHNHLQLMPIPLSHHSTFGLPPSITPITSIASNQSNHSNHSNQAITADSPDTIIYSPDTPSCIQMPRLTLQQSEKQKVSIYQHVTQQSSVCEQPQRISMFRAKLKRPSLKLSVCEPIAQQSSVCAPKSLPIYEDKSMVTGATSQTSSNYEPQFRQLPIYGDNATSQSTATSQTSYTMSSKSNSSDPTTRRSSEDETLSVIENKKSCISQQSNLRLSVESTVSQSLSLSFETNGSSSNSSEIMHGYTPISYVSTPHSPITPFSPTVMTSPCLTSPRRFLYQSYEEENDVHQMAKHDHHKKSNTISYASRISLLNKKCDNKKKRKSKSKSKSKRKIREKSMSQNY